MGALKTRSKFWGDDENALNFLRETLPIHYELCFPTSLRPSDQGGFHFYCDFIIGKDWRGDPATERQKKVLDALVINYDPDISKGEASDIIRAQLDRRSLA